MTGTNSSQFGPLHDLFAARCASGRVGAVSLGIVQRGALVDRWAAGALGPQTPTRPVSAGSRFLVASLTKPVTAAATMRLVEDGRISLMTPVASLLPEFAGEQRDEIRVWHLLTHTSGLPDMVATNTSLREEQAALFRFFEHLCRESVQFPPGRGTGYQSMGSLVLAMVAERIVRMPFAHFVKQEIFEPAGMANSSLGLAPEDSGSEDVQVDLPAGQRGTNWHWNSRYWRTLGAPWGGLITTATDLAAFLRIFLDDGRAASGRRVLAPATVAAMRQDWTSGLERNFPAVGLGWLLRGKTPPAWLANSLGPSAPDSSHVTTASEFVRDRRFFGDLMSKQAFGHTGATGCAMWADPAWGTAAVLLTNSPDVLSDGTIPLVANMIASAVDR